MNPNDIPRWLNEHGGADGPPQTDANGVTTHRARDGSYLTVFNGQVRMVGHGSTAAPGAETAPAQPAQRPGGGMDQAGLEAIINGFGPLGPGDFREEVKQEDIPNPAAYDENGQYILGAPLTIKGPVTYRTWIKPGTNIRLTVKVNQDGSYTQVFNGADSSIQPSRAPDAQAPKEEKNPNDPTRMRRWNPQTKQWEDAGPNQEEIDRRAKEQADRNKPGAPTLKPDGKGGTVAIQTMPDGSIKTTPLPGVPSDKPNPPTITVEGVVYERGENGVYKPAAGIPTPGIGVKNVDQFVPDYTQPDLGLGAWAAKQRQKIGLPPDQGGITQKDYDAAVTSARDQATVTITNITNNQGVVRQQALDNQAREDKQAGFAENDLGRKQSVFDAIWKYTTPGSEAIRAWMPDAQSAQALRQQYAGQAKPMPALHPMFTSLAASAGVTTPPPGTPPATNPAAPAAPVAAPPNAIGAGAVGNQPAPGAAPAPAAAPPATLQSPGQSGMMSPVLDSENPPVLQSPGQAGMMSPVLDAENPPVQQPGSDPFVGGRVLPQAPEPAPAESVMVPPLETPPPWAGDPNAAPSGGAFPQIPAIPRAGTEAGGNVQKVMPQGPVTGWAMQALGTPPGTVMVQPQQAVNPALQQAAQGAGRPLFDPYQTAGRMATLGIPQDAIATALRELGFVQDEVPA